MPFQEVRDLREMLDSLKLVGKRLRTFHQIDRVMNRAFFPGGPGLYERNPTRFPKNGTLILGSNFGNLRGFVSNEGELVCRDEVEPENGVRKSETWKNLIPFLVDAQIDPRNCFFSNVFPVLHEGKDKDNCSITLPVDLVNCWLSDEDLTKKLNQFFEFTLAKGRPHLVVILGVSHAARFLNSTWAIEQKDRWAKVATSSKTPRHTNGRKIGRCPVVTVSVNELRYVATAIPHPSDRRNWSGIPEYEGETGIVRLLSKAAGAATRLSAEYRR